MLVATHPRDPERDNLAIAHPPVVTRSESFPHDLEPTEIVGESDSLRYVLSRVERIVDEKTGNLIQLPNPCLILDGVTCSGMLSSSRMFCPRKVYPFWREIWLTRVSNDPHKPSAHQS